MTQLQKFLQGDNPNLIGSIFQIKNHKYNQNSLFASFDWQGLIFYINHFTGRIERYSIYNKNFNRDVLSKLNKDPISYKSTYMMNKTNFISFIMYLAKEYWGQNVFSYDDPNIAKIMRLDQDLNIIDRENFIDYKTIDKFEIAIPKGINIPLINLAMTKYGLNLIQIDKKSESQLISNFRSVISRKNITSEEDIIDLVKNFNYSTRLKIERLKNK